MKTYVLLFFFTGTLLTAFADDTKFKEAMQKNITSLYASITAEDLQRTVNVFDRIGAAEKNRWEPFYYSSYGYIRMSINETSPEKKDALLDLAKISLDKAAALKSDDVEILALDGFISMLRITIDPQTRGQQYSGMAMQSFHKALALDPQNPRAIVLNAQMQYGMAKFFGNTSAEACENAKKALTLLAKENPSDVLAPRWGKVIAEKLLKECGA